MASALNPGAPALHKQRMSAAERRASKPKKGADRYAIPKHNNESDALAGYEMFHNLPKGSATLAQVCQSSYGIAGWAGYGHACRHAKIHWE